MDRLVPISEARARLGELLAEADEQEIYVLRHGRPAGVLVSIDKFEGLLNRIEDLEDQLSVANATDSIPFVASAERLRHREGATA